MVQNKSSMQYDNKKKRIKTKKLNKIVPIITNIIPGINNEGYANTDN
jgi:hypothetical protein